MLSRLFFALTFLLAVTLWFLNSPSRACSALPGGPQEGNARGRAAWEKRMLADPETGEIPAGIHFREQWFAARLPAGVAERGAAQWVARGPYNVGGRTRALAMDITNENRLLAGGVSGGVWLSEDGGASWNRKTPLLAHPGCVSIAQDTRPGKTNTWYYLSGEVYGTSASGGGAFYLGDGLFKSTDSGHSWSPITSTAGGNPQAFSTFFQTGWRVVTSPTDSLDVVYLATVGAIYRSANGGNSWTAVRGGNTSSYSYFTDVAISPSGVLYATLSSEGPQKGIWRSTNGTNWINILPPAGFPATYNRFTIGINPDNENEVFFLGSTPGSGHYNQYIDSDDWSSLWKYTYVGGDGSGSGGQWTDLSANLPKTGTEFDQFASQGGYDLVVKVQPGTGRVFVGGTNIYRSDDGFSTPHQVTQIGGYKPGTFLPYFELYPNHHPDQHDLLFLPSNPQVLLSASDGGVHRTDNCHAATVSWDALNNGYTTTQFYTALFRKSTAGDPTLIGGLQDNGNFFVNSDNPTAPWKQTVNGDGAYGAFPDGKSYTILSIQQGRVAKCALNAQGDVTAYTRIDPQGPRKTDYQFINPLALDPADPTILYLPAGKSVYRQENLDALPMNNQWDSISTGWLRFPDTLASLNGSFSALAVSTSNPAHRLYVGSDDNKLYRADNAHTGTPMLELLPSPFANSSGYISCIAVDPDNGDDVVVVYSNYSVYSLWRSLNGGATWIKVGGNLEAAVGGGGSGPSIRWLSILPLPGGGRKYFAGTSVGLYSADTLILHATGQAGTVWTREAADLIGSSVVSFVDVRPSDQLVVAATHGLGMFSALYDPAVSTTNRPAPEVRLWPNPATSWIEIAAQGLETVLIYSQDGRCMYRGKQNRVSVAAFPAGLYYYRLSGAGWQRSGTFVKSAN